MSIGASAGAAGLPVVNQALEPAWVRHGSASTQKTYETALAFEETLVNELSQSLAAAGGLGEGSSGEGESAEDGGASSGATASPAGLSAMVPQALSQGVMNAGGLGLAAQLTRDMQPTLGTGHTGRAGGTAS